MLTHTRTEADRHLLPLPLSICSLYEYKHADICRKEGTFCRAAKMTERNSIIMFLLFCIAFFSIHTHRIVYIMNLLKIYLFVSIYMFVTPYA